MVFGKGEISIFKNKDIIMVFKVSCKLWIIYVILLLTTLGKKRKLNTKQSDVALKPSGDRKE